MRVLVVEDEVLVRTDLVQEIREAGHTAEAAPNGRVGLELMRRQIPDVVLLDLRMPVMDGHVFNAERSSDPALASVPIILISGNSRDERARSIGATAIFDKPINVSALLAELARLAALRS
jgi:CheY-like chemotaxis protein